MAERNCPGKASGLLFVGVGLSLQRLQLPPQAHDAERVFDSGLDVEICSLAFCTISRFGSGDLVFDAVESVFMNVPK
jgi:hypothetical protein